MTAIRATTPAMIHVVGEAHMEAFNAVCAAVHAHLAVVTIPAHKAASLVRAMTIPIVAAIIPNKAVRTVTAVFPRKAGRTNV